MILRFCYDLTILYSILVLVYYLTVLKNDTNNSYLMLLCSNFIANIGDVWVMYSHNTEEALLAMKVSYIGNAFMLYFMFRVITTACRIKLPKLITRILLTITLSVLGTAMMIGENQLFYKGAELIKANGYSYLVKEYGPLHNIYFVVLIAYMIGTFVAAVYALFTPSLVSRINAFMLAMTEVIAIAVYFGERSLGLKVELMPFSKCLMITFSLFVVRKLYLYDANRVSRVINETVRDNGIILFDENKNYLGSNAVAGELFTEINSYNVERPISTIYDYKNFFENILDEFSADESSNLGIYEKNDEIYKIRVRNLVNGNLRGGKGFVVELVNDTKSQNYIKKINEMNVELEEAVEKANSANEAKSSFLANMSHEIRTPINAVLGLNSIILRDTKEERTREFAKDIDGAGKSLLALINDILDFSKVEAGKMDLVPVEFKTATLINDCQSMLYGKIKEKGLNFKLNCNEHTPSVLFGDEIRLRQIIINLLTNAVKYTESGTVFLNVDFKRENEDLITLIISVADTGIGISEENQKHLFESFKRVDEKRNRNIEGTGLGLVLVQNLVHLMDGDISVESELNKGSIFEVKVSQKVISWEPVGKLGEASYKSIEANAMDALSETTGKILVVDDVKVNLKVFVHLLEKSKLKIIASESGMDAIEKSGETKFDIIFLDHMMPEMDGIETLHRIREDEGSLNRETPIIMLTANAIEGIKEKYINEGFDDYLSKPINFNPLKDMILRFL